jgi:superfamily II DNA or RNA helicase
MDRLSCAAVLKECSRGLYPHNREALGALHQLLELAEVPLEGTGTAFADAVADTQAWVFRRRTMVEFDFNMATGAGKTRLALRAIQYLARTQQSRTFLVLSHRRILRDRWLAEFDADVRDSIGNGVPVTVAATGQDLLAKQTENHILVVVQTLQTLSNPGGSWAETLSGPRLNEILSGRSDLVVIVDESHHLGEPEVDTEWSAVVESLDPRMLIGLTATPTGARPELYEYSLARMLHEGAYSKSVSVVHHQMPAKADPQDVLEVAIREAVAIRNTLQARVEQLSDDHPLRSDSWRPKVLFACRTRAEVRNTCEFLMNELEIPDGSILPVTGDKKDDSLLAQLVAIDSDPDVDYIVSAYMLDEGWDVTSVSVVCPLRELGSPTNARQLVGRGLRLPEGRRTGNSELECLSVISVGQKSLVQLREEITEVFSLATSVNAKLATQNHLSVPGDGVFERRVSSFSNSGFAFLQLAPADAKLVNWNCPSLVANGPDHLVVVDVSSQSVQIREAAAGSSVTRIASVSDLLDRVPLLNASSAKDIARVLTEKFGPNWKLDSSASEVLEDSLLQCFALSWIPTGKMLSLSEHDLLVRSKEDPTLLKDQKDGYSPRVSWYSNFAKSLFDQGKFDVRPEFEMAQLLDALDVVDWWLRNDPKVIRVPTATGIHSPDFIVRTRNAVHLVELKGAQLRLEFDRDVGRVASLRAWCDVQSEALKIPIHYQVFDSASLDEVLLSLEQ